MQLQTAPARQTQNSRLRHSRSTTLQKLLVRAASTSLPAMAANESTVACSRWAVTFDGEGDPVDASGAKLQYLETSPSSSSFNVSLQSRSGWFERVPMRDWKHIPFVETCRFNALWRQVHLRVQGDTCVECDRLPARGNRRQSANCTCDDCSKRTGGLRRGALRFPAASSLTIFSRIAGKWVRAGCNA